MQRGEDLNRVKTDYFFVATLKTSKLGQLFNSINLHYTSQGASWKEFVWSNAW